MKKLHIPLLAMFVLIYSGLTTASKVHAQNYECSLQNNSCIIQSNPCPGGNLPVSCGTFYRDQGICPGVVDCATGVVQPSQNSQPPINTTPADPNSVLVDLNGLISALGGLSNNQSQFNKLTTLGGFVGALLPFLYAIAGIALLGFLIAGGFMYLTSAGDPKRAEAAKTQITTAIIGFIIVIVAFWATQMVQYIFLLNTPGGSGLF